MILKKIFTILLSFACTTAMSRNFYLSASGSDGNNGLSIGASWKSVAKLNSVSSTFMAGDSILFHCGETFHGSIIINKSGLSTNPIIYASYGTGAKPILSGLFILHGWTNIGGNLWECIPDSATKGNENVFLINGLPYEPGRTPNGFGTYTSATTSSVTASGLAGLVSYAGAEIVWRCNAYSAAKGLITTHPGNGATVNYVTTQAIDNNNTIVPSPISTPGYGYFIQRHISTLDVHGEWFYDKPANKMKLYSTVDPNTLTIQASYVDTVFNCNNKTNIKTYNLRFEGGGMYGFESFVGSNVTVDHCDAFYCTKGIYIWNTDNAIANNNLVRYCFNGGIIISNNQRVGVNINGNKLDSVGMWFGLGLYWSDNNLNGIVGSTSATGSYVNIIGNAVDNVGQCGIKFQGSNVRVSKNWVDSFDIKLDDNGGIYTFSGNGTYFVTDFTNRLIDSNFISNAIGAGAGAGNHIDVAGGYNDDQTRKCKWLNNIIWNIPGNGFQWNTPVNDTLIGNIVYNCNLGVAAGRYVHSPSVPGGVVAPDPEVFGNYFRNNIIYQAQTTHYIMSYVDQNLNSPTHTPAKTRDQLIAEIVNSDLNYITNLQASSFVYYPSPTYTLAQIKTIGQEVNSILPPVTVTTSNTNLYINWSSTPRVVTFTGLRKIDPKGTLYDNGVILLPYTGLLLIDDGSVPVINQNPVANPGSDQTIQAPANLVTLNGTASTDPDGTISSWAWLLISGPAGSNFGTANASTTTFNNLTPGDYFVQLTVTDNLGAMNSKTVHIHVDPAPANQAPTARAGTDVIITSPASSTGLNGSASTDPESGTLTFNWIQYMGVSTAVITGGTTATPTVSSLIQGTYLFQLTVTDPLGATSVDYVQVTVNAATTPPNDPPVARAGVDQQIQSPASSVALDGTGSTDSDGFINEYIWSIVSGPSAGIFSNAFFATTTLSGLVPGDYLVKLRTKDNAGDTSVDYMTIRVLAPVNLPPIANVGTDDHIQAPVNSVNLSAASSFDPEGDAMTFGWKQISGPSIGIFGTPNSVNTTFGSLIPGLYVVQVKVIAAGDSSIATKQVQVDSAAVNNPPAISSSTPASDTTIVLPNSSITLSVTAIDADGSVSGYTWSYRSGPGGVIISTPNGSSTLITGLTAGTHVFRILITDNGGATTFRDITVIVQAAPTGLEGTYLRGFDVDH